MRSEHFSEVIKDRRLVYLSPNAPRAFENGEFDHDAVYVVGGIVDKAIRRPVTHAKARRAGKLVNLKAILSAVSENNYFTVSLSNFLSLYWS